MSSLFTLAPKSDRSVMLMLFLMAWALRVAVVFLHPQPDHYLMWDTHLYWESAVALVDTGFPVPNGAHIGLSYFMMPFVALGMSLWTFGHFIQPMLGAAVVALVWLLGRILGGRLAGALAGVCCLLHPALLLSSAQVVSEDLSLILLLGAIVLVLREKNFSAGVAFGLANIVRSPSLGCFALLLVVLVWSKHSWSTCIRPVLLGWALIVLPCSVHLSVAYGRPAFVTAQVIELYTCRPLPEGGVSPFTPEEMARRGGYFTFAVNHPLEFLGERWAAFHAFIAARFELWTVGGRGRPLKRIEVGPKLHYCLRDLERTRPGPDSPRSFVYPGCSQQHSRRSVVLGTSVGWSDIYPSTYHQNWINVTGLHGCFAFYLAVDPKNHIRESNEHNNRSHVFVRLPSGRVVDHC